jgi:hypothetical protein
MRRRPVCAAPSCWTPAAATPGEVPLCDAHLEAVRSDLAPPMPVAVAVAQVASIV